MRRRFGSPATRDQYMPFTARLSDSVPPEVKMTSEGWAPAAVAMVSRASSTARRARRPDPCRDDGLPVRASSRVRAASAAPDSGVVAAWSRYAGILQFYRGTTPPPVSGESPPVILAQQ